MRHLEARRDHAGGRSHHAVRAGQLQAAGFTTEFQDLGQGRVNLVAKRGTPKLLLNCHLDTVPVDPKWTLDPFTLTEAGDKVHGLGSCDIKGAAACMLTAVEATDHDVAVLFNTDEEAGHGDCIEHFLAHTDWHPCGGVAEATEASGAASPRLSRPFSRATPTPTWPTPPDTRPHTTLSLEPCRTGPHRTRRHFGTRPLQHWHFGCGVVNVVNSQMLALWLPPAPR